MAEPFVFVRQGRRWTTIAALLALLTGLAALRIAFAASLWILAPLGLAALPLLHDILLNPHAFFRLDDIALSWRAGRREGHVPLDRIARARMDTGWDFSVRVTFELTGSGRAILPPDCTPPHRALEAALLDRGIPTVRHHFTGRGGHSR